MPIVDGLTSTKMIREFEHSQSDLASHLSPRAALNSRVPIIAVSASLIENKRQSYIDAGFDAWILKPISFSRLTELMTGIVDKKVREEALYKPGEWEKGGWFELSKPVTPLAVDGSHTDTSDFAEGASTYVGKSRSAPQLRVSEATSSATSEPVTGVEPVQSPDPM
jgi:CheY-like chemotaxis protein